MGGGPNKEGVRKFRNLITKGFKVNGGCKKLRKELNCSYKDEKNKNRLSQLVNLKYLQHHAILP